MTWWAWLAIGGAMGFVSCLAIGAVLSRHGSRSGLWREGYDKGWDDAMEWARGHRDDLLPGHGASVRIDQPMTRGE